MIYSTIEDKKNICSDVENINFDSEYDLVVAGLGTAGAIALITSAAKGLKTFGIEKLGCMGGSATAGGVSSYYCGIAGGIYEEIDLEAEKIQNKCMSGGRGAFHPSAKIVALEQRAIAEGAEFSYNSTVTAVYREERRVVGVKVFTPGGFLNIKSRYLIDATADGEVCALCGCDFNTGRETDGTFQPYTFVRYLVTGREKLGMSNFDAGYIDPRDGRSVSDGIIHAGTLHLDGSLDENLKISYVAPIIGGREGRLIKGEDTLRFKDFIRGDYTDEPVFYEYSNHDTHSRDWAFESEIIQKWLTVANMWGQNFTVPVSAGTMLPKGFSGILAVGRCLSADHDAAQSVRMQMAMQKSGQAAVILCAASTVLDKTLKNVPYNFIKDELESAGLLNGKDNDIPFRLIDDAGELKEKLASKDPGTGIWAAYVKYEKFSNFLREWVVSGDECLARSSALALGLAGDTRALPLLRKIVRERDMFMPETGRELRTPRICSAIYLLAEMNDFDCIETLLDIMNESDDFFVISNAFSGLLKMLERNPEIRKEKAERMEKIMLGKDFQPLLNMKVNITTEDMTYYMRIKAGKAFDRWGIPHSLFRSLKDNLSTRDRILMKFEPENY